MLNYKFKLFTILGLSNLIADYNLQSVGLSPVRVILYNNNVQIRINKEGLQVLSTN